MTVTVKNLPTTIRASRVLYSDAETIDVLVAEIITSMAEGSIDMICDGGESEYPSKASIESCLSGCAQMGEDFVEDMINELREKLLARLRSVQVQPTVKAIHFDATGYSDITVDIEIV